MYIFSGKWLNSKHCFKRPITTDLKTVERFYSYSVRGHYNNVIMSHLQTFWNFSFCRHTYEPINSKEPESWKFQEDNRITELLTSIKLAAQSHHHQKWQKVIMKSGCFTDLSGALWWSPSRCLHLSNTNWFLSWQIQMNRSNGDWIAFHSFQR